MTRTFDKHFGCSAIHFADVEVFFNLLESYEKFFFFVNFKNNKFQRISTTVCNRPKMIIAMLELPIVNMFNIFNFHFASFVLFHHRTIIMKCVIIIKHVIINHHHKHIINRFFCNLIPISLRITWKYLVLFLETQTLLTQLGDLPSK